MLITKDGTIVDPKVTNRIQRSIEKGPMPTVSGIIVHQTGGATAQSTFRSYSGGNAGAHLLIDKDGTIYQTAHLDQMTWHIGKLQARCVAEFKCRAPRHWNPSATDKAEKAKKVPERYPSNRDAIGIELVGLFDPSTKEYESVTVEQNVSLKWLIGELQMTLKLNANEVFRHPDVSYKEQSEASTAHWK